MGRKWPLIILVLLALAGLAWWSTPVVELAGRAPVAPCAAENAACPVVADFRLQLPSGPVSSERVRFLWQGAPADEVYLGLESLAILVEPQQTETPCRRPRMLFYGPAAASDHVDVSGIADGQYRLCLWSQEAGKFYLAQNHGQFLVVDREAPELTYPADLQLAAGAKFPLEIEDATAVQVRWFVQDLQVEDTRVPQPRLVPQPAGLHIATVEVTDAAGNQTARSIPVAVAADTQAPLQPGTRQQLRGALEYRRVTPGWTVFSSVAGQISVVLPSQLPLEAVSGLAYRVGNTPPKDCHHDLAGTALLWTNGKADRDIELNALHPQTLYSLTLCYRSSVGGRLQETATVMTRQDYPAAVVNLEAATTARGGLLLSWLPGGPFTHGYSVAYQLGDLAPDACAREEAGVTYVAITDPETTFFKPEGLQSGQEYGFAVCAHNGHHAPDVSVPSTTAARQPSL